MNQADNWVFLTERAARQLSVLRHHDPSAEGKPLRLYVEQGGCSGLRYGMVFDEVRVNDRQLQAYGETVVIDEVSADYLQGVVLDYSDDLNDSGFKITNPNARQSCGCGKSFEV